MSDTNGQPVRIEHHVRMFHARCGGLVTGELGRKLICAESSAEMRFFVSDTDNVEITTPPVNLQ